MWTELITPLQTLAFCIFAAMGAAWVTLYLAFATAKISYAIVFPSAIMVSSINAMLVLHVTMTLLL